MGLNQYIEHTNVKATATEKDIRKLCEEAIQYHFSAVCVNPHFVPLVKEILENTSIDIVSTIGFPLGANTIEAKVYEAIDAIENGATDIDLVVNIGAIKDHDFDYVKQEIEEVRDAIDGKTLKIIIETCYLTKEEIQKMTEICNETYVNYIKTSTGFGSRGVSKEDIETILKYKNEVLEIKASGGIHTYEQAFDLIEMGVSKIGTSHSLELMKGEKK